jgi:hypothetical protein
MAKLVTHVTFMLNAVKTEKFVNIISTADSKLKVFNNRNINLKKLTKYIV